MLGVFLSLFKTVDLSAHHFRYRRRRPHSCSPQQQDQIFAQAHRTCRGDRSLQFSAEIEAIVPQSRCHHALEGRRVRKADSSGDGEGRFVKHRARSIAAPTFSTSTLTTPDRCMIGRLCDQKTHEYPPHPRKPPAKKKGKYFEGAARVYS